MPPMQSFSMHKMGPKQLPASFGPQVCFLSSIFQILTLDLVFSRYWLWYTQGWQHTPMPLWAHYACGVHMGCNQCCNTNVATNNNTNRANKRRQHQEGWWMLTMPMGQWTPPMPASLPTGQWMLTTPTLPPTTDNKCWPCQHHCQQHWQWQH